ncbi:hypothetical protein N340_09994, partial [Tauraco erythrolophus]
RNNELLSKVMSMHKHSENMNDPSHLTAVLHWYEMLRVHNWEKLRSSRGCFMTYRAGSSMIKKLFDACEKDIQERISKIFEVLEIPPLNDTMTIYKQGKMQEIRNLLRYSYYEKDIELYSKIITQADVDTKITTKREFAILCCRIYCLLLLQDPPVKAVWNLQENSKHCLEHVDRK